MLWLDLSIEPGGDRTLLLAGVASGVRGPGVDAGMPEAPPWWGWRVKPYVAGRVGRRAHRWTAAGLRIGRAGGRGSCPIRLG